ncbi:hypothetical protein GPECTOR_155g79 [Gonium pectorale]|uniref:Sulfhydryl oxidase n=1 Tax=Gonium pectorale TaxID=33097 RepID=A0A150FXN8_GONPE|nr:hypothetical protein GPECTOR_155g79 [Gonium pectorale]|eukprot:KXZ42369.1 hypothetical protein GPECTOR_155g79 [Gonium pectorale]
MAQHCTLEPSASAASAAAAAKAEVGRATWTLLHSLAAQFPDRPTRQQRRDAAELVWLLTRVYPCGDCAAHLAELAEVGRATWTLLHSLAAQFPDRPTRQQRRDAAELVWLLTRVYPCGDCAAHLAELVRRDPPVVSSGPAFRRWLCGVHNRVNARLGKPAFNCELVEARWAPLGCGADVDEPGGAEGGGPARAGCGRSGCELLAVGSKGPARR